jgi:hypothetical protein
VLRTEIDEPIPTKSKTEIGLSQTYLYRRDRDEPRLRQLSTEVLRLPQDWQLDRRDRELPSRVESKTEGDTPGVYPTWCVPVAPPHDKELPMLRKFRRETEDPRNVASNTEYLLPKAFAELLTDNVLPMWR